MKDVKVTCDACGKDLTYTGNCVDYRLLVTSESLGSGRGEDGRSYAVTAMMIYPPVDRSYHFCNLRCLRACPEIVGEPVAA